MSNPVKQPPSNPPEPPLGRLSSPRSGQTSQASHGGAWKVAYADFVTAMMALFIVLWMMNSTRRVKASITGYFRDPKGYTQKMGAGPSAAGEGLQVDHRNVSHIQKQIEEALRSMPEFPRIGDHIQFSVTGERSADRPSGNSSRVCSLSRAVRSPPRRVSACCNRLPRRSARCPIR